ncbi:MAG: helix-turn-helix domain-containing protein [Chitinophagales bacterium]
MKDAITFIEPQSEILAGKIKLYYFHSSSDQNYKNEITYYPNYTSTLNVYQHSSVQWSKYERTHSYQESAKPLILLAGKINKSRKITLQGLLNKITIVFNPLGLNHFVETPLSSLIAEHFSFFDYFGSDFEEVIYEVFETSNIEQKRDLLDNFFLSHLRPFTEHRLKNVIIDILKADEPIKISNLAQIHGIHRRTLLRLFQKHLAYSMEEFLSVVKFRKAMIQHQSHEYSLTRLALEANYYDQSHFIKNCTLKCGESPKTLFSQLKVLEKGLFWKLK